MTRVKICGICRLEDAELATDLGAAAIGFVFAPSPRRIRVEDAAAIARALPPYVERVGIFVAAGRDEIERAMAQARLTRVQLDGSSRPELAADLPGALTCALRADDPQIEASVAAWRALRPDTHFLIDLPKDQAPAEESMWSVAARLARTLPLTLAGGLNADNVFRALLRVRPRAVDVARGVEARPGIKDAGRLRAFFAAVAGYDAIGGSNP